MTLGAPAAPVVLDLDGDVTAWLVRDLVHAIRALPPEAPLTLRINSEGGDVLEGFRLANALRSHPGHKTAVVESVAASAATFPICACDSVKMFPESMLMLHAPWQLAEGNADDLTEQADVLRKMEALCLGMYQRKTGATEEVARGWLSSDSWMTPGEAVKAGFCSEILTDVLTPAARARAARYLARIKRVPAAPMTNPRDTPTPKSQREKMAKSENENQGIPDGGAIPENLRAKLAKHGMGEDPSHEEMMAAYDAYMEETDDGPDGRREMKRCMERMSKMAEMGDDEPEAKMNDDMDEESSADKSKKMAAKLRQSANLDPAVAKLVDSLTGQVSTMGKKLSTFEAKEKARAEESFYAAAEKYTSREDAADYVSKCGGDTDKAMALIKKLPQRSVFGRLFAGGSPVGGASAKDAPVENTKTLRTGRGQTTTLHGITLAALAKKKGGKTFAELAAAQVAVARERPDLYQPR